MSRVGYVRVSSSDQSLARQLASLKEYNLDKVYKDTMSGKDFNRPQYQKMRQELNPGDELYIKELDRLGRNKDELKQELQYFKDNNITLRILDIPTTMIDFDGQTWIQDMVTNILVEVLSSMAEQERLKIRQRQKEGIEEAQKQGVQFGRPKVKFHSRDLVRLVKSARRGDITHEQAYTKLGLSRSTYYRLAKNI